MKVVAIILVLTRSFLSVDGALSEIPSNFREGDNFMVIGSGSNGLRAATSLSDEAISISSDGAIVAVGSYLDDNNIGISSGNVIVYKHPCITDLCDPEANFVNEAYIQMGQKITASYGYGFGHAVSISSNGQILAIGAPLSDQTSILLCASHSNCKGIIYIYRYDSVDDKWMDIGMIHGDSTKDFFGENLSLSSNGKVLAGSSRYHDNNTGYVRVWSYEADEWVQMGSKLNGIAEKDQFGSSISLSEDGPSVRYGQTQKIKIKITLQR